MDPQVDSQGSSKVAPKFVAPSAVELPGVILPAIGIPVQTLVVPTAVQVTVVGIPVHALNSSGEVGSAMRWMVGGVDEVCLRCTRHFVLVLPSPHSICPPSEARVMPLSLITPPVGRLGIFKVTTG